MYTCVLPLPRQEEAMKIAGIDVHKKVLMVVVVDTSAPEEKPARRRFVTLPSELQRFRIWLQEQGVEEAVMESTAQYWRSVWLRGSCSRENWEWGDRVERSRFFACAVKFPLKIELNHFHIAQGHADVSVSHHSHQRRETNAETHHLCRE